MASQGVKIGLGASKIDPLAHVRFQKSIYSMCLTHFYRFLVNFEVLLGGVFGEKIGENSMMFSMLCFYYLGKHF